MKSKTKSILQVLSYLLLASVLASCSSRTKFVAPEIEPPADLIPGYVPEGFELVKGYQVSVGTFERNPFLSDDNERRRILCDLELPTPILDLKSPAGNDILGIHYQNGDSLLLINKSYYPGGSLDLWQAAFEGIGKGDQDCESDCDCCCGCTALVIDGLPFPLRSREVEEVRTVGETQVAVLESDLGGLITVFVHDDYLIAVEGDLPLEEHLRIIESLLDN